jgi:hypothetical protein
MKSPIQLNYDDCVLIMDALEDAYTELEQLETQSDWYSGARLVEKLEEAREILNLAVSEAGHDAS